MTDRLLDAEAVAELIGMRTAYVYRLVRRDEIPHLRFGRTVRFRPEAITEWLEDSERGTAPGQGDRVGNPRRTRRRRESNRGDLPTADVTAGHILPDVGNPLSKGDQDE